MADPCTKFEVSSLTVAEILHGVGVKFYKWSPDSEHAPFRGDFFIGRVGRYDTRCYFNVRSKADISQLNLPHGTDN